MDEAAVRSTAKLRVSDRPPRHGQSRADAATDACPRELAATKPCERAIARTALSRPEAVAEVDSAVVAEALVARRH